MRSPRKTHVDCRYTIGRTPSGWRLSRGTRVYADDIANHVQALDMAVKLAKADVAEGMTVEIVTQAGEPQLEWFGSPPPRKKT